MNVQPFIEGEWFPEFQWRWQASVTLSASLSLHLFFHFFPDATQEVSALKWQQWSGSTWTWLSWFFWEFSAVEVSQRATWQVNLVCIWFSLKAQISDSSSDSWNCSKKSCSLMNSANGESRMFLFIYPFIYSFIHKITAKKKTAKKKCKVDHWPLEKVGATSLLLIYWEDRSQCKVEFVDN